MIGKNLVFNLKLKKIIRDSKTYYYFNLIELFDSIDSYKQSHRLIENNQNKEDNNEKKNQKQKFIKKK